MSNWFKNFLNLQICLGNSRALQNLGISSGLVFNLTPTFLRVPSPMSFTWLVLNNSLHFNFTFLRIFLGPFQHDVCDIWEQKLRFIY